MKDDEQRWSAPSTLVCKFAPPLSVTFGLFFESLPFSFHDAITILSYIRPYRIAEAKLSWSKARDHETGGIDREDN